MDTYTALYRIVVVIDHHDFYGFIHRKTCYMADFGCQPRGNDAAVFSARPKLFPIVTQPAGKMQGSRRQAAGEAHAEPAHFPEGLEVYAQLMIS